MVNKKLSPASPPVHERYETVPVLNMRSFTLLAGIRADGTAFIAFPKGHKTLQWLLMKTECNP